MITFKVTPDGGEPYTVTAGARDVLQWERTNPSRVFSHLATEQRMVDLYSLAYTASRRHGLFTGELRDFENTCDIKALEDAAAGAGAAGEGPDPTNPGQ